MTTALLQHANKLQREIESLRARLTESEAECLEQARLNGMGSEREARLMARVAELERELESNDEYVTRVEGNNHSLRRELVEAIKDAARYQWLRSYNTAKHPSVTEAFFLGDKNLDAAIDEAIKESKK